MCKQCKWKCCTQHQLWHQHASIAAAVAAAQHAVAESAMERKHRVASDTVANLVSELQRRVSNWAGVQHMEGCDLYIAAVHAVQHEHCGRLT
jgi:hypothetical protein